MLCNLVRRLREAATPLLDWFYWGPSTRHPQNCRPLHDGLQEVIHPHELSRAPQTVLPRGILIAHRLPLLDHAGRWRHRFFLFVWGFEAARAGRIFQNPGHGPSGARSLRLKALGLPINGSKAVLEARYEARCGLGLEESSSSGIDRCEENRGHRQEC